MDKLHLDQHISRRYNEELEQVRTDVIAMGRLARDLLDGSLQALLSADAALGRSQDAADDRIDAFERSIDGKCQDILARRHPAATDLRLVIAVLKTITDFERMGDEAQKMARMAIRRAASTSARLPEADRLRDLGAHVGRMLDDTLVALASFDGEQALRVCSEDPRIDEEYKALVQACLPEMAMAPANALDVVWAARALERIGDHACNICEHLIYVLGGEDVRHTPLEEAAKTVRKAHDRR